MAKRKKNLSSKHQAWVDARKRFHLSHAHVQMARELGMNPKKLGGKANHKQEPWKLPLPDFIEELYRKRFGKTRPDEVRSIEQMVKDTKRKRAERKARKREERERQKANPNNEQAAKLREKYPDMPALLTAIRARPGMFLGHQTVNGLHLLLSGIWFAEDFHDLPRAKRLGGFDSEAFESWVESHHNPERLSLNSFSLAARVAGDEASGFDLWFTWYDSFVAVPGESPKDAQNTPTAEHLSAPADPRSASRAGKTS